MNRHGDGPAASGGHRFASDAWRSGVPRDWAMGLAPPVVRERLKRETDAKAAADRIEKDAMTELKAVWNAHPNLRPLIAEGLQLGIPAAKIAAYDQFKVLIREQERRRAVFLRETGGA